MTLRYTKRALTDLDRILSYTAQHSPQGAANVRARLDAILQSLEIHPRSGRTTDRPNVRMRILGDYPYLIFYGVDLQNGDVTVLLVGHTAKREDWSEGR